MNIKWYDNPYGLNQDIQSTGYVFSFINKASEQINPWVLCRDYLHDIVRTNLTDVDIDIYGLQYGPGFKSAKLDLDKIRLLVSTEDLTESTLTDTAADNMDVNMMHSLMLLNHYEGIAGVPYSTVTRGYQDGQHFWKFVGNEWWLKHPSLVSMYSLLIRLGDKRFTFTNNGCLMKSFKEVVSSDDDEDNDKIILDTCYRFLHLVAKSASEYLFDGKNGYASEYWNQIGNYEFHDECGIQSLCSLGVGCGCYGGNRNTAVKVLEV